MHLWPSNKVLKTSKHWHSVPPKGLGGKELQDFYNEDRINKLIMLNKYVREKSVDNKSKKD